jgi:hypothetical protein
MFYKSLSRSKLFEKHFKLIIKCKSMKRKTILAVAIIASIFTWQCTKDDMGANKSLKESLNSSAQNLNTAVNEITKTKGYKVLSLTDNGTTKSFAIKDAGYNDSITLAKIAGIYEYHPVKIENWCFWCYNKLFEKKGASAQLIVKLPSEKVFSPWKFRTVSAKDTTLKNNFVITTTDYHYYYSNGFLNDYKLAANVAVSDTALGNIAIDSKINPKTGYNYSSVYTFSNGYDINVSFASGDSAKSSISLSKGTSVLFKEMVTRIKTSGTKFRERQYDLVIGNVEIRKSTASDSVSVYLNGTLQVNSKVEIIDKDSTSEEGAMCKGHDRDIKITFDDGTSTTLSELLGPTLTTLQSMVASLGSVYFAKNIVDYIAFSIHFNH